MPTLDEEGAFTLGNTIEEAKRGVKAVCKRCGVPGCEPPAVPPGVEALLPPASLPAAPKLPALAALLANESRSLAAGPASGFLGNLEALLFERNEMEATGSSSSTALLASRFASSSPRRSLRREAAVPDEASV